MIFEGKTILITGGTGTWGYEFTSQLLAKKAQKIIIFSRNESAQVKMKNHFNSPKLVFILGDIREKKSIREACRGVNIIFHTAALKHVTKCEQQPREALHTNICGAINVINAAIYNNVDICVNISSDKACYPSCFYGNTKAIAENLFTEANNRTQHTDFFSVRSGNIFGSSGSVVPIWIEQIKRQNYISVTDPSMTRFFITIKDAVMLTFNAMHLSDRGEVFVFNMPSFSLMDLSIEILDIYSDSQNPAKAEITGIMPGERMEEWLVTHHEARRMVFTKNFFIVYPSIIIAGITYPEKIQLDKRYKDGCSTLMNKGSIQQLKKMIRDAGFTGNS